MSVICKQLLCFDKITSFAYRRNVAPIDRACGQCAATGLKSAQGEQGRLDRHALLFRDPHYRFCKSFGLGATLGRSGFFYLPTD